MINLKQGKKTFKIVLIILSLVMLTGCTKTLTDSKNKPVKDNVTGQSLTQNILCKPTNKNTITINDSIYLLVHYYNYLFHNDM